MSETRKSSSQLDSQPTPKTDCYSDRERKGMERYQIVKGNLLHPLLALMATLRVTPDAVTVFAGVIGLMFVPFWMTDQKMIALGFLFAHVVLDGLDGALARHQNVASSRGSFTDAFVDQIVVTGVTIAWIVVTPTTINIAVGVVFVFFYVLVVAFAMARNSLAVPYAFLIRPRYFFYAALAIDGLMVTNATFYVLLFSDGLLAVASVTGFLVVRRQLPGSESENGEN
jgi:phosphatidylglycerophosphate synthase